MSAADGVAIAGFAVLPVFCMAAAFSLSRRERQITSDELRKMPNMRYRKLAQSRPDR
jgi:hypothetical protein